MQTKTCCFTGHRTMKHEHLEMVAVETEKKVRELILEYGYKYFLVGGAIGYDTFVAQILFRLRDIEFPQIRVILAYPFKGFTDGWTDEQKITYAGMLSQYDDTICVSQESSRGACLVRDRYLVDHASFCISYCTRRSGGTAYTVRYALQKGLPVCNVADFASLHE